MDKNVIIKISKYCGESCPDFKFENPLLDKEVAKVVSKGFIKLLGEQDYNNVKNRLQILENIRKSCKVEPPEHLSIDDNVTEILRNAYEESLDDYNINKVLDTFLIRNLKELNISSLYSSSLKPDIIQALVNLNDNKHEISNILLKDIIHWNIEDGNENSYSHILKSIWNYKNVIGLGKGHPDDISIKMKPLIEKKLLPSVLEMLSVVIIEDIENNWFYENKDLLDLSYMCSASKECFQICCSIMNNLFLKTNFDTQMHKFITLFIESVKCRVCSLGYYYSQLYPSNLQHIVLLLDIELDKLDEEIKSTYIANTLKYVESLRIASESDMIMLLSHFDDWFKLYYDYRSQ